MPKSEKSRCSWSVKAASGADAVIERTCSSSSQLLVLLVSQNQFYVKRGGRVKLLDEHALELFFQGAGSFDLGVPWCSQLDATKKSRERFMKAISLESFADRFADASEEELICARNAAFSSGAVFIRVDDSGKSYDRFCSNTGHYFSDDMSFAGEAISIALSAPALLKHVSKRSGELPWALRESTIECASIIFARFGLDCAKAFIDAMPPGCDLTPYALLKVLYTRAWRAGYLIGSSCLEIATELEGSPHSGRIEFSFKSWLAYAFNQSKAEGYGDSINRWFDLWSDTLAMQLKLYGKVGEKYPRDLLSYHNRLACETRMRKQALAQEGWDGAASRMSPYEDERDGFSMVAPKCAKDVEDEARSQHNCLISYIGRILDGTTMVLFLRRSQDPRRSFVTVEVSEVLGRKTLCQAKADGNAPCPQEAQEWLDGWCARNEIAVSDVSYR